MDDDAMEAVDEALAEVFRERKLARADKKQKQEEKKADIHFKLRVLDLLDIFIKKQSSSPLILDLILPLLSLIRNGQGHTDMTPLVNRAENLFRNKLCKTKEYPKENLDRENAHTILEQLLHIAQTGMVKEVN
jgi:DNA polymerase phi